MFRATGNTGDTVLPPWFDNLTTWLLDNTRGEDGDMCVYNGAAEPHPAGRRQALPAHRLPAPRGSPRPPVDTWFQAGIDDATADLCVVWPDLDTDTVVIDRGISPRLPKMDRPYRFLDVPVTEG